LEIKIQIIEIERQWALHITVPYALRRLSAARATFWLGHGYAIPTPKLRHSFVALQTYRFAYSGYKTVAYSQNVIW